jgi:hypothetical protein
MASMRLLDLLPDDALAEITLLMREGRCVAENLKHVTGRYKNELLARGIDSEYLAYAIALKVSKTQSCA